MKAMILKKQGILNPNSLELEYVDIPKINYNEVLIKIKACGVCHTDLHEIEGDLRIENFPIIPGHEIIGIVSKIGNGVKNLKVGDRVGISWLYSSCENCKYCLRNQQNLCLDAKFTGYSVNGGYTEYIKINSNYAYKIPDVFSDLEAAPLMCAGVIGYRSIKLSELKSGETIGLFGFGASAHIVIQIAKHWNCDVFVFTRSKNHQEHALELGAKWVGNIKDQPPKKIDRGIIFAPVGEIVVNALNFLNSGGTLAINAIHMSDIPSFKYSLLWHERKIISVANVTRNDAIEFLELAGKIPIKTNIVSYKLEDVNFALLDMKMSKINGAAVLKI